MTVIDIGRRLYGRYIWRPLLLQAGMGRAGSTLAYRILEAVVHQEPGVRVKKKHKFSERDAKRALVILTARRDIRDVVASEIRQEQKRRDEGYEPRPEFVDVAYLSNRHRQFYENWAPYSSYEFVYEDYQTDPDRVAGEIIEVVGSQLPTSERSVEAVRCAAEGSRRREMSSQLHRTNDGKMAAFYDVLSPEEVNFLEREWAEWLDRFGYLRHE